MKLLPGGGGGEELVPAMLVSIRATQRQYSEWI
jgi:hypothetical protein